MKPNFFIVGAPKCGTTYLATQLGRHPSIEVSDPKEPHFFGRDLLPPTDQFVRGESEYISLFTGSGGVEMMGEASTLYLSSKTAAREISQWAPEAKIIAILREPVAQMYSMFSHRVYSGNESTLSFRDALALEGLRRHGSSLPNSLTRTASGLFYRENARYYVHLNRYSQYFPENQIKILFFDDLVAGPLDFVNAAVRFLGLEPLTAVDQSGRNENKRNRTLESQRIIQAIPIRVKKAARAVLGEDVIGVLGAWAGRLGEQRPRFDLTEEETQRLRSSLKDDIRNLEGMTGRHLTHWVR